MVPTVDRGLRDADFWSIEIAGDRPSMKSTSGLSIWPEELAGVGRQRLDVAALALGVDRVERERRLPRAGEPGEDDQLVARQLEVDVAEVVLHARPDPDRVRERVRHRRPWYPGPAADRTDVRTRRLRSGAAGARRSLVSWAPLVVATSKTAHRPARTTTTPPTDPGSCRVASRQTSRVPPVERLAT